jgi:hypothetical protein
VAAAVGLGVLVAVGLGVVVGVSVGVAVLVLRNVGAATAVSLASGDVPGTGVVGTNGAAVAPSTISVAVAVGLLVAVGGGEVSVASAVGWLVAVARKLNKLPFW